MKILGVDLGQYSVKIAELDVTSKGTILSNFYEFPLSPDPTRDRSLETLEILRRVSAQMEPGVRWVVGVTQPRVSVHNKRFPFRERAKIQKSLAFELEDDIPLDIDETIFDAKIIEHVGPFTDVLTVACPLEAVEELLQVCKDGGFDPEIVSVEGLSLANAYERFDAPIPELPAPSGEPGEASVSRGAKVILQMGHTHTNMLVYREDSLIAVRSLLWGGTDILDGLTRAFGVPVFEAIKVLREKSFILMNSAGATKDQVLLSRTISTALDGLIRDVKLTLLEMRATYNLHYEGVELTGGICQIQNLGAYFTQSLEIPTNISRPFAQMQASNTLRGFRLDVTPGLEAVGALAVGLALEGAKRPRNPAINLRKGAFARENETLRLFWETWQVPIQVASVAFVLFFMFAVVRDMMATSLLEKADERVAEVAAQLTGRKGAGATDNALIQFRNSKRKQITDAEALKKAERLNSAMDIVASLSQKLPVTVPPTDGQGLNVSQLSIDNDKVTIQGRINALGGLPNVERALKEIAKGGAIKTAPTTGIPPGTGTAFAYTFQVERSL